MKINGINLQGNEKKKKDNKKLNRFQWEDQLILLF